MEIFIKKKSAIIKKWTSLILETYPSETSNFLKAQKNQFSNPVGFTICNNAEKIFDEIIRGQNFEKIESLLDDIIKIRAIQQFSPSDAIQFIFFLKKVILDELGEEMYKAETLNDYYKIEERIDRAALIAFDLYVQCKEKVFQIRVKEIKNNSFKSLEKTDSL